MWSATWIYCFSFIAARRYWTHVRFFMQLPTRTEYIDRVGFRILSWRGQNAMRSIHRACSNTTFPWLDAVPLYVHSIARVTNCDSKLKSTPINDHCSVIMEGCSITVCQFTKICSSGAFSHFYQRLSAGSRRGVGDTSLRGQRLICQRADSSHGV